MPVVVGIVGAIVGAVASAVTAVATVIGSAIVGAVAAVVGVIGSVLAPIAKVIEGVVAGISSIVAKAGTWITQTLGQTVEGFIETVGKPVGQVLEGLKSGIEKLVGVIEGKLEPVLSPIKDALQLTYDKLKAIDTWIRTQLKPLTEVVDLVEKVTSLKVLTDLMRGQADIMDLINELSRGGKRSTAVAIASLLKSITELGINLIDHTEKQYTLFSEKIRTSDETFKAALDQLQRDVADKMAIRFDNLDKVLFERTDSLAMKVAAITRRTEDLPWFAYMLLQVLK